MNELNKEMIFERQAEAIKYLVDYFVTLKGYEINNNYLDTDCDSFCVMSVEEDRIYTLTNDKKIRIELVEGLIPLQYITTEDYSNYMEFIGCDLKEFKQKKDEAEAKYTAAKALVEHLESVLQIEEGQPISKDLITHLRTLQEAHVTARNKMIKQSKVKTYFFRNTKTKAIKIGKSNNPEKRLTQVQGMAGAKLEIIAVIDKDVEYELHTKFKKYQIHSEWFNDKDGLILEYALSN